MSTPNGATAAVEDRKRLSPVVTSFVAGTVAGVVQAIVGHPFDTVKSRVQMGAPSISACIRDMVRTEGPLAAYKGVLPPIVVSGAYNATLFSSNAFWTRVFTPASHRDGDALPLSTIIGASVCTAPAIATVICPSEVIKVRLQLQQGGKPEFAGVLDCAAKTFRNEGPATFLKGFGTITAMRVVGLPFYFTGYTVSRDFFAARLVSPAGDGSKAPTPGYIFMMAGGVGGVAFWSACYPLDFLKTRVQSAKGGGSPLQIAAAVVKEGGVRAMYKGLSACLLRAVPANASAWYAMETTKRLLNEKGY
jgi:solute carrier family 25 carnitine/acylcarnitine transporter 20/29